MRACERLCQRQCSKRQLLLTTAVAIPRGKTSPFKINPRQCKNIRATSEKLKIAFEKENTKRIGSSLRSLIPLQKADLNTLRKRGH